MSNGWITDRLPTEKDTVSQSYLAGCVWVSYKGSWGLWEYGHVYLGLPWMPITPPEPYVKPKRFVAMYFDNYKTWGVQDTHSAEPGLPNFFNSREIAERIAAIYEEITP